MGEGGKRRMVGTTLSRFTDITSGGHQSSCSRTREIPRGNQKRFMGKSGGGEGSESLVVVTFY